MIRRPTACITILLLASSLPVEQLHDPRGWDSWQFLVGEWMAEGGGQPGQATGTLSFKFDLQGKVLVRKSRADYPATKDRPAFSHEDLMVIHQHSGAAGKRAIYFDNEGHVIHYAVEFSEDQKALIFLSNPEPSAPRFRLTYVKGNNGALKIKFEIAPPGKSESFST